MKKILIIDDEIEDDGSKIDNLRSYEYDIDIINHASGIRENLEKSKNLYSAIILDIMMPPENYATLVESQGGRFTGKLILRDIRKILGRIPVLILTAHDISNLIDISDDDTVLIEKPASSSTIDQELKKIWGNH